ncbi:thioredoxin-domain-containing protein [Annulohypoxylon maeteangense]|uniref:thioredoxin-domain-containing protein n=1 Tax=Annulohypoxylon maeteangense TaxID=1927788 RepID=UPI002008253C|nr:thioredoxin-domain-containing protein [Annulohypoxylon maeteangense]KAI0890255.1 thioredoxin-domain-containing protein [Annulohypoxylon maeteangense]
MSTNFFRTVQSSLRHSVYRPSHITPIRQFHTTLPRMTVHNILTADAFHTAVKENKVVLLDCFATWCGPCKAIAPLLANHSNDEQFKDIFFAKIDVDELPELSQELGITSMPTFMIFKDGEQQDKLIGANPGALVALLKKSIAA